MSYVFAALNPYHDYLRYLYQNILSPHPTLKD